MSHVFFPNVRSRKSEMESIGELESLLDDFRDDIPFNIYEKLVKIYEGLDDAVSEMEDILSDRDGEIEDLKDEIDKHNSKIEELEYDLERK